ncbi:MAG TPA: tetratricopeptide repeat protein [Acetobacteraceae bacterium]|nr:tetratricopeptide repeat protein [Acetobacteraceae bacterium]
MRRMKLAHIAALLALLAPGAHAADYGAYLTAQFAADRGDSGFAASEILAALGADPSNPALQKDAFALSLMAGRKEAEILAPKLADNPMAQLLLADVSARSGDWVPAELAYAELPHDPVMDSLRPLLLAWSQQAQGRTDKALDTLQGAINSGHYAAFYLLHAALIADVAHRDGLADRLYGALQKELAEPNVRLAQILASWQARSGHMDQARATIEALGREGGDIALAVPGLLRDISKPQISSPKAGIAEAYAGMAGALRQQNEQAAVAPMLIQLALMMHGDLTEARLVQADLAVAARHYDDAIAALRQVPSDDPLAGVVRLHLALYQDRVGNFAAAESALQALATDFPDQAEPLARLGDVYTDNQKYADAVGAYTGAIARIKVPAKDDWSLFYARGAALERVHDWPRAEADMKEALKLSPDQPAVLNFLGFSWTEQNHNLPLARDMIRRALEQRPNDGAIIDSMGWVDLHLGDVHQAVQLLQQAAELQPVDPTITGHLGDAYWEAGRHIEAEDQWRQALILKPDADEAARIEARLKSAGLAEK